VQNIGLSLRSTCAVIYLDGFDATVPSSSGGGGVDIRARITQPSPNFIVQSAVPQGYNMIPGESTNT
jgi:hypothetical protein